MVTRRQIEEDNWWRGVRPTVVAVRRIGAEYFADQWIEWALCAFDHFVSKEFTIWSCASINQYHANRKSTFIGLDEKTPRQYSKMDRDNLDTEGWSRPSSASRYEQCKATVCFNLPLFPSPA